MKNNKSSFRFLFFFFLFNIEICTDIRSLGINLQVAEL